MSKQNKSNNTSNFLLLIPAVLFFSVAGTVLFDIVSILENFVNGVQAEEDWNKLGIYYLGFGLLGMLLFVFIIILWAIGDKNDK